MTRIVFAGCITFVVVAVMIPFARRFALAKGITDHPAAGKAHTTPTPYLGGVAIALGAVLLSFSLPEWKAQAAAIFAGAVMVGIVGLVDDVRTVQPKVRLLVEIAAASIAVAAGAKASLFGTPIDYVITVVWIVVITNAFNLLDNMDAACGVISTIIASALAVVALLEGQQLVGGLAVVVAAACLAFLIYNWHPARIFMGDAGALFLGYLLAVISLKIRVDVSHFASAVSLVLLVGPAVFDTALVVVSRVSTGRHIFMGGTDHTSHRLVLLGFGDVQVAWILSAFTACSCTLGVLVAEDLVNPWLAIALAIVPASVAFVYLLRIGVYAADDGGGRNRLLKRGTTGDVA
jgi:UDP-GlcNAc:undecaprenyl-phosphate GlcNAc-1-phosphate transferase